MTSATDSKQKKILLLSAYDADSHRRWHTGLVEQLPEFGWTLLTLPARHFTWRIRGNSLTWAFNHKSILEQDYDALVVTSMVDLSALRGFVPKISQLPTLVYFHENQFQYPKNDRQHTSVEPQIVNLYTSLCADQLVFNSQYNHDTFIAGVQNLLKRLPDHVPPGIAEGLQARARVLPVPLENHWFSDKQKATVTNSVPEVVWNHRWEYDKGPDLLLALLERLPADTAIQFHIVGQQFRQQPPEFTKIRQLLESRGWLGQWGYIDSLSQYQQLLQRADFVLSTARHDFQGLAVMEAVAAGCKPLVPDREAYPEWFGSDCCYDSFPDDSVAEACGLAEHLLRGLKKSSGSSDTPCSVNTSGLVEPFRWSVLRKEYQSLLEGLMKRTKESGHNG